MSVEIERKFLIANERWRSSVIEREMLRDGLIGEFDGTKVRVRVGETKASLTVKGPRNGSRRVEFEYEIPKADAETILVSLCGQRRVEKIRHKVSHGGTAWIVDAYEGKLAGITLAEIELPNEAQDFEKPDWVGREVTDDPRFERERCFGCAPMLAAR
jgi:adenylate cyclase